MSINTPVVVDHTPLPAEESSLEPQRFLGKLLVATDGSDNGDRAVDFAVALAQRHGSSLEICFAVDRAAALAECCSPDGATDLVLPVIEELDDAADAVLAKALKRANVSSVTASTRVLEDSPVRAIVDHAVASRCDAIVMGTKGKRGLERLFLGSTADGVIRRATVPVIVVPPGATHVAAPLDAIFVAVDDSDPSDAGVGFAIELARSERARLVLCGVVDTEYLLGSGATYAFDSQPMLDELREAVKATVAVAAERAEGADVRSESMIVDGAPAATIATIALSHRAGAIVIGTHGRRGLRRLFVGSVAESVVQNSHVPVIVVRGPALR